MAKFRFRISRDYTVSESFEREFEALNIEEAQALADIEAAKSDMDCPDDCSEDGDSGSTDFIAERIES